MRLSCPVCGARDSREFTYLGSADLLDRPEPDAGGEAFDTYIHARKNPVGMNAELWQHSIGCRAWLLVERDATTHEIHSVRLARDVKGGGDAA